MSAPPLSVVLPLHRTADSLDELLTRLVAVCPEGTEYVLVDDACPEDSGGLVLSGWAHLPGRLLRTRANIGQLAAVQAGLRASTGDRVAVLDADLQDAPEDLSTLLATLEAGPVDVVCAGRSGHYARGGRERTARLYRRAVTVLSLGRVPAGAGLFSVLSRHAVDRVVALDDHAAPLVPALARARLRIRAVPVQRRPRPRGTSATGSLRRSRIAAAGLVTLTPLHPVVRRLGPHRRVAPDLEVVELGLVPVHHQQPHRGTMTRETHNEQQIAYFTGRELPRMDPVRRAGTPYTRRHLSAVAAAARLRPGDRVVDVGCGPGKYTVGLADLGYDVTGLDLTPALVRQLRDVAPHVHAVEGDLLDPPAQLHGSFDAVTGFFVLHHLADLDAAFAGTRLLARPGGRVVFIEPNAYFPGFYVQVTLTPGMSWRGDKGIVHMRAGRLRRAAEAAGLRDVEVTTFGAFPPALANRPWGRRMESRLERVPGWDRAKAFVVVSGTA